MLLNEAFIEGDYEVKRSIVASHVHDWLRGDLGACASLASIVSTSSTSPARLDLIEAEVSASLLASLASLDWQEQAASVGAHWLDSLHPAGAAPLTATLRDALERLDAPPQERASLLRGIELLASASLTVRMEVIPVLLAARASALLEAVRPNFVTTRTATADIARLKGLSERSPYEDGLAIAFPSVVGVGEEHYDTIGERDEAGGE